MLKSARALFMLMATAGCSPDPTAPKPATPEQKLTIVIEPDTDMTGLHLGDTIRLDAARVDSLGNQITDDTVRFHWSTSDTTVAVVFANGLVRIVGLGEATIRARIADQRRPSLPNSIDTSSRTVNVAATYTVLDDGPVEAAALRREHQCLIRAGGVLVCRGRNFSGQTGTGGTAAVATWMPVTGGRTWVSVATGIFHTCALTTEAQAFCWGRNAYGETGNGTRTPFNNPAPTEVAGGHRWNMIQATGLGHSCGTTTLNSPMCFGYNQGGQVGRLPLLLADTAVAPIDGGHQMTMVVTDDAYGCGLRTDGAVYCWGLSGPPTNTPPGTASGTPSRIGGDIPLTTITIGASHGCGLDAQQAAYCWGAGGDGQLGIGERRVSGSMLRVAGNLAFARLFAFEYSTCGISTAGDAYCWGYNRLGAPLARTDIGISLLPVRLRLDIAVKWIGRGRFWEPQRPVRESTCAIDAADRVICWGGGY